MNQVKYGIMAAAIALSAWTGGSASASETVDLAAKMIGMGYESAVYGCADGTTVKADYTSAGTVRIEFGAGRVVEMPRFCAAPDYEINQADSARDPATGVEINLFRSFSGGVESIRLSSRNPANPFSASCSVRQVSQVRASE